jgi:hypothetical protein
VSDFQHEPSETRNKKLERLALGLWLLANFRTRLPDVTSPSLDQYLQLSPKERALQDSLYWEQLMNPQRLAFLAALLKMSLRTKKSLEVD